MEEYIALWEHIKPIVESDHFTGVCDENQKFFDMSDFMIHHATHKLVLHDEYGRDTSLDEQFHQASTG